MLREWSSRAGGLQGVKEAKEEEEEGGKTRSEKRKDGDIEWKNE